MQSPRHDPIVIDDPESLQLTKAELIAKLQAQGFEVVEDADERAEALANMGIDQGSPDGDRGAVRIIGEPVAGRDAVLVIGDRTIRFDTSNELGNPLNVIERFRDPASIESIGLTNAVKQLQQLAPPTEAGKGNRKQRRAAKRAKRK